LDGILDVEFPVWDRFLLRTSNLVPAVRLREGTREAALFHWGLIPPWAKDQKEGSSKVNARSETVAMLKSFRTPFQKRRCLMVADGFYEYRDIGKKEKEPHYFTMSDGAPFAFAGIWEVWKPKDQPAVESCSMLTTQPNELLARTHDRMPVILPQVAWDHWLSPSEDVTELTPFLAPYPPELMRDEIVDSPLKRTLPEANSGLPLRNLFG
jgi:putative SOS response-associated peptidase YedK